MNSKKATRELREKLAELEHEQWKSWTDSVIETLSKGNIFDELNDLIGKWKKNFKPYCDLSEEEKDKDREWADKVLKIVSVALDLAFHQGYDKGQQEMLEAIDEAIPGAYQQGYDEGKRETVKEV